jgi:hypothetical protein
MPEQQRRGRSIAMTPDEIDAYLQIARVCRLGSLGKDGSPHVSALWFVWDGKALWLNSLSGSQRWANIMRDPRLSVLIDGGESYNELHGVELIGRAEVIGDVPRTTTPVAELEGPESMFGAKYANGTFLPDGRHAWLRLTPDKVVSWDFRKMRSS